MDGGVEGGVDGGLENEIGGALEVIKRGCCAEALWCDGPVPLVQCAGKSRCLSTLIDTRSTRLINRSELPTDTGSMMGAVNVNRDDDISRDQQVGAIK